MMMIIKEKIQMLKRSKVVQNGAWLYVLQIFNTAIPLITLPYITRILGASQYGVFSSSLNLIGYFQVVVEYGFNLSGARKIAMAKDEDEISRIFSSIMASQLLLCLISFFAMMIICFFINITRNQFNCMVILYLAVFGTAIEQIWLFQGLQVMQFITIVSVFSRTISVVLIFVLVRNAEQVYLYCGLYAITFLLIGIISLLIVILKLNVHFKKVTITDLFIEIKDGWYLFTTSAMTRIFSGIGITVLTFTSTNSNVGIYAAIQKIPLMLTMLYAPIGQAIYPYVSQHYASSFVEGINIVKKISKFILPIVSITSLIIILGSKTIINIVYGSEYSANSYLLIPLICWMVLGILNNLLGIQVLVASGHLREYSTAFRIGVIAIVILNIVFGVFGKIYGVAIAAMLAELTLTIAIIFQIRKIKRKILG